MTPAPFRGRKFLFLRAAARCRQPNSSSRRGSGSTAFPTRRWRNPRPTPREHFGRTPVASVYQDRWRDLHRSPQTAPVARLTLHAVCRMRDACAAGKTCIDVREPRGRMFSTVFGNRAALDSPFGAGRGKNSTRDGGYNTPSGHAAVNTPGVDRRAGSRFRLAKARRGRPREDRSRGRWQHGETLEERRSRRERAPVPPAATDSRGDRTPGADPNKRLVKKHVRPTAGGEGAGDGDQSTRGRPLEDHPPTPGALPGEIPGRAERGASR